MTFKESSFLWQWFGFCFSPLQLWPILSDSCIRMQRHKIIRKKVVKKLPLTLPPSVVVESQTNGQGYKIPSPPPSCLEVFMGLHLPHLAVWKEKEVGTCYGNLAESRKKHCLFAFALGRDRKSTVGQVLCDWVHLHYCCFFVQKTIPFSHRLLSSLGLLTLLKEDFLSPSWLKGAQRRCSFLCPKLITKIRPLFFLCVKTV